MLNRAQGGGAEADVAPCAAGGSRCSLLPAAAAAAPAAADAHRAGMECKGCMSAALHMTTSAASCTQGRCCASITASPRGRCAPLAHDEAGFASGVASSST